MIRLIIFFLFLSGVTFAQSNKIHIGNEADVPSAILQIDSDSKGILIPRMSSMERNLISDPAEGLFVYDTDDDAFWLYDGFKWIKNKNEDSVSTKVESFNPPRTLETEEDGVDVDIIKFKDNSTNPLLEISEDNVRLASGTRFELRKSFGLGFQYDLTQNNSLRIGHYDLNNSLRGDNSVIVGDDINNQGDNSLAIGFKGNDGKILGANGLTVGEDNNASGLNTVAFGQGNKSSNENSTSWGFLNDATGNTSLSWGFANLASGINSTAWGSNSTASNLFSMAFGSSTSEGLGSVTWGTGETSSNYSFCWGDETKAYTAGEITLGHNSKSHTQTGTSIPKLFVVATGTTGATGSNPYLNAIEVLNDDQVIHKNDVTLINDEPGLSILGLYEETNGTLFGFEFQNNFSTQEFRLRSKSFSGNDAIRMRINTSRLVGLGKSAVTNKLEINGTASKSTAGPWSSNSDERLKKNIVNMDSQEILEKVLQMEGVIYEWDDNGRTGYTRPTGIQYGFIAQDLQKIWPDKVSEDALGYLQTAYGDFDPFFVGAFKSHQSEIEFLKNENEEARQIIDAVTKENEALLEELAEVEALVHVVQEKLNN